MIFLSFKSYSSYYSNTNTRVILALKLSVYILFIANQFIVIMCFLSCTELFSRVWPKRAAKRRYQRPYRRRNPIIKTAPGDDSNSLILINSPFGRSGERAVVHCAPRLCEFLRITSLIGNTWVCQLTAFYRYCRRVAPLPNYVNCRYAGVDMCARDC